MARGHDDEPRPMTIGWNTDPARYIAPESGEWNPAFVTASMLNLAVDPYSCWDGCPEGGPRVDPPDQAEEPKVETWRDRPPML